MVAYIIYLYSKYKNINTFNISNRNNSKIFILQKFCNMKINEYTIHVNFNKMKDHEKKEYILYNMNKYNVPISENQLFLLFSINQLRQKNNLDKLIYEPSAKIRFILLNEISEPKLLRYKHNFKIFGENYLFIDNINEFQKRLIKKDSYIRNALLIDNLTNIVIFEYENIQYILIYNSYSFSKYKGIKYLSERYRNNLSMDNSYSQCIIINSENTYFD